MLRSTRPFNVREWKVLREMVDYIRKLRETYLQLEREKIKVFLDTFCKQQ
ncbi:MAG TPA: hypothetical protein PLX23_07420 [Candidatus Hydrogenedens sp.]|nr:hypothetical protein [Candidatus Hydrogenedens sp.]